MEPYWPARTATPLSASRYWTLQVIKVHQLRQLTITPRWFLILTKPTLSGITLVSTNANNSQAFAKPGDNITLSFNSSEPIQIPSISLADNDSLTVHDTSSNQDGKSWKAVYTVTAGEAERDTTFSIDFKDIAGNEGVSKAQTDVTNTIKIDTSIPTLSVVSLSGGSNNLANEGDVVTLSFTGSENLKDPMVIVW